MKTLATLLVLILTLAAFNPTANATSDKLVAVILLLDNGDDQQIIQTIYTTLMAAEKVAKVLEIEMLAQDEVNDDVFVFSLKSEAQKDLTMKLFDEEGYELAAHRVLQVNKGSSYRALNVESLTDGTYMFKLTDKEGAELNKKITIKREEK
ncbi:T9SS C-terminal target domain-containing protein [Aureispira anguillae]|uniref:T9SS C-terminal target domain-containing protein n=1 Tax=Aureispira anguillae TaxID=2864201 RepID=A0A915YIR5_9BACT|nr:T9SS C-terminal target domain-containing protein [Aureispira anguillae]BDS13608.1 T9SS C-terminal target domain-containing protein [Aureispira anguillae]